MAQNLMENVDVTAELERFTWRNAKWTDEKLIASSPFRDDSNPSFFVDLRKGRYYGCWHDSGAVGDEFSSGNFPKLLAFLHGETYEEACEYLREVYGVPTADYTLEPLKLQLHGKSKPLSENLINPVPSKYLKKRGISEATQTLLETGFDRGNNAVVFPWRDVGKTLGNIKYRRADCKVFWYASGGIPIRQLIYGMYLIYENGENEMVVTEGEVDALSFIDAGYPAVALGNAHLTRYKLDLIKRSRTKKVYICVDNDKAGRNLLQGLTAELVAYKQLYEIKIPLQYKDANELYCNGNNLFQKTKKINNLSVASF